MDVFSELKASGRAALLMIVLLVGVLLGANVVEYLCGTLFMAISFVGLAGLTLSIALRVDPTLSLSSLMGRFVDFIVSVVLVDHVYHFQGVPRLPLSTNSALTTFNEFIGGAVPAGFQGSSWQCTSDRLGTTADGWAFLPPFLGAPTLRVLGRLLPRGPIRRIVGVKPPVFGPPFVRVAAAALSQEWPAWLPSFGLRSLFSLPGRIAFEPDSLEAIYSYTCQDTVHGDFYYVFPYGRGLPLGLRARPATVSLLHALGSFFIKMLLLSIYAGLFMLLENSDHEALVAELRRRAVCLRRRLCPPPVRHWPPPLAIPEALDLTRDGSIPKEFLCPLTLGLMRQPAITPHGTTYDYEALASWADTKGRYPANESSQPLARAELAPNRALRSLIEALVAARSESPPVPSTAS